MIKFMNVKESLKIVAEGKEKTTQDRMLGNTQLEDRWKEWS